MTDKEAYYAESTFQKGLDEQEDMDEQERMVIIEAQDDDGLFQ